MKTRYTVKFMAWLKNEPIENQEEFSIRSLYEIYVNSIVWNEIPTDSEIPKAELIVRM